MFNTVDLFQKTRTTRPQERYRKLDKGEKGLIDRLMIDRQMNIPIDREIEKQKIKDYIETKTNFDFFKQKVPIILY